MAILWADGFEDWAYASATGAVGEYENHYINSGTGPAAGVGRRGGQGLSLVGNAMDYLTKTLPSTYTELFASFAWWNNAQTNYNAGIFSFTSGGSPILSLRRNPDGSLSALRNGTAAGGTVIGTSAAGLIPANAYCHLQVRVVFSTSAGIVQVRMDGATTPILNLSSVNTGGANADGFTLSSGGYNGMTYYYDDLVINDTSGSIANSWLGDVRVDTYFPNANGDLSQMTGSDGDSTNNYALVNAAAPGSTYVQSQTVGHEDLYGFQDMTHTPAAIYGVIATGAVLKDDGGARAVRLHCKSGAVDARSAADITLSTTRKRATTVFETDPNTGAAWTRTSFNAAQFGYEVTV